MESGDICDSAQTRSSISLRVFISVAQTNMQFGMMWLMSSPPIMLDSKRRRLTSAGGIGHITGNSLKNTEPRESPAMPEPGTTFQAGR